jgi:hypothetical protein
MNHETTKAWGDSRRAVWANQRIEELERQLAEIQCRHAQTERDACMWAERAQAAERALAVLGRKA